MGETLIDRNEHSDYFKRDLRTTVFVLIMLSLQNLSISNSFMRAVVNDEM